MNSFEQYTVIIGVLAVLFEGLSYLRDFLRKLMHKKAH
jgi:hypothetical protein